GEHFDLLARLNHGARGWRVHLSGGARGSRRNVEAWKEACSDKLFGGRRIDRASEYWLESPWLTCCVALRVAKRHSHWCIFFVIATASCTAKMSILRAWRRNLARHFTFTAPRPSSITTRASTRRSHRWIT